MEQTPNTSPPPCDSFAIVDPKPTFLPVTKALNAFRYKVSLPQGDVADLPAITISLRDSESRERRAAPVAKLSRAESVARIDATAAARTDATAVAGHGTGTPNSAPSPARSYVRSIPYRDPVALRVSPKRGIWHRANHAAERSGFGLSLRGATRCLRGKAPSNFERRLVLDVFTRGVFLPNQQRLPVLRRWGLWAGYFPGRVRTPGGHLPPTT